MPDERCFPSQSAVTWKRKGCHHSILEEKKRGGKEIYFSKSRGGAKKKRKDQCPSKEKKKGPSLTLPSNEITTSTRFREKKKKGWNKGVVVIFAPYEGVRVIDSKEKGVRRVCVKRDADIKEKRRKRAVLAVFCRKGEDVLRSLL